jgi:uncharacterized protein YndB with AHSA1/START domain
MVSVTDELRLTQAPTANAGMLIRRPPEEVFTAFVDPEVTTRFWFTKSSGRLGPGASVEWSWEMYGVSAKVWVKEFEENRRLVFDWGSEESSTSVEMRFIPWQGNTYVHVTASGFPGDGDQVVARALDSTGGFTMVLSAAKALLEHDVVLTVVADKAPPPGVEL